MLQRVVKQSVCKNKTVWPSCMHSAYVEVSMCLLHTPLHCPDLERLRDKAYRLKRLRKNTKAVVSVWNEAGHTHCYWVNITANGASCCPLGALVFKILVQDSVAVEIVIMKWNRNFVHGYFDWGGSDDGRGSVFWRLANNCKIKQNYWTENKCVIRMSGEGNTRQSVIRPYPVVKRYPFHIPTVEILHLVYFPNFSQEQSLVKV